MYLSLFHFNTSTSAYRSTNLYHCDNVQSNTAYFILNNEINNISLHSCQTAIKTVLSTVTLFKIHLSANNIRRL